MKLTLAIVATFASAPFLQGALYTLNNGSGSTAAGIQTIDGKTFRSGTVDGTAFTGNPGTSSGAGIVAFRFFSTDNYAGITQPSGLVSLFTRFGAEGTFAAGGTGGNRSIFSSPQNQTIGNTFNGKNIYLFAGNGSTFANSSQFLIVKSTDTFILADDITNAVTPKLLTVDRTNGTTLFGTSVANVFTTNTDATQTPGFQMAVVVPEPSSALLGAVGALALLRRRRLA